MPVVNQPDLREIALRIVSSPGFETSNEGMIRAFDSWIKALTVDQRHAAEKAFTLNYLLDMHAVYRRDSSAVPASDPGPSPTRHPTLAVEPEPTDEPDDTPSASVAVLRFSSESENWSKPPIPAEITRPEQFPSVPKRATPPSPTQRFSPVVISRVAEPEPKQPAPQEAATVERRAAVQQEPWHHRMFPVLQTNRRMVNGVVRREGELTAEECSPWVDRIDVQLRKNGDEDTQEQARIDRRNELNELGQRGMRARAAHSRELQAERDRVRAAQYQLKQYPEGTTIEQLGADVLAECHYERRSA